MSTSSVVTPLAASAAQTAAAGAVPLAAAAPPAATRPSARSRFGDEVVRVLDADAGADQPLADAPRRPRPGRDEAVRRAGRVAGEAVRVAQRHGLGEQREVVQ